jgi:hypothetical protein
MINRAGAAAHDAASVGVPGRGAQANRSRAKIDIMHDAWFKIHFRK